MVVSTGAEAEHRNTHANAPLLLGNLRLIRKFFVAETDACLWAHSLAQYVATRTCRFVLVVGEVTEPTCQGAQVESHPYFRNEALRQWCAAEGIHMTAYSPLGSPDSAAMFKRSTRVLLEEPAMLNIAARLGKTAGQVSSVPIGGLQRSLTSHLAPVTANHVTASERDLTEISQLGYACACIRL